MGYLPLNVCYLVFHFFSILFVFNMVKTRVYIYLILNFFLYIFFVSLIFYYLQFEVIAFLLILVYAGAVVILFTFVVMLYENHRLLFISSSYVVLFIIYVVSAVFTFFFFGNSASVSEKHVTVDDVVDQCSPEEGNDVFFSNDWQEACVNIYAHECSRDFNFFLYLEGSYDEDQLPVKECRYGFKRFKLSENDTGFDVYQPTLNVLGESFGAQEMVLYYNYFDSFFFRNIRVPYFLNNAKNITISDLELSFIDRCLYFNEPIKIVDPVTGNTFILDKNFFDLTYMYSRFFFDTNLSWNLDLYSMFMYVEHFIKGKNEFFMPHIILPDNMNIKHDFIGIEKDVQYLIYNVQFYPLNHLVAEIYNINIWDFLREGELETLNNIFKVFDEISLSHSYQSFLTDFSYFYLKGDYLFNVIGFYLYSNCLFEFMVLGFMLFICLICVMRLLKNSD